MDVKTAFLNADLSEEIYLSLPEGYRTYDNNNKELVWKLNKALYGLKQAPRAWWQTCHKVLTEKLGFKRVSEEYGLYV